MKNGFGLLLVGLVSTTAFLTIAESSADENGDGLWFIEGRYSKSFNEKVGWTDLDTVTPVAGTTGNARNNLNSMGLAVGFNVNNGRTGISVAHETFNNKTFSFLIPASGNANISMPMKLKNQMIEVSHKLPLTQKTFFMTLLGLGKSRIKTDKYSVNGTLSGTGKTVSNTSTRLGGGLGYTINKNTQLLLMLQKSDYGDSEVIQSNNAIFKTNVSTMEAGFRVRLNF
jgi:hypothetical protein